MLIIGDDVSIIYENVCMFYVENYSNIQNFKKLDNRKSISLIASMNNNRDVELKRYETEEEAHNIIESIAQSSKETTVFHL